MYKHLLALAGVCCLFNPIHAQTATTSVSGSTITTVVTDAAGDVYTVSTPFSLSIQSGTPTLSVKMAPPPTPPPSAAPAVPSTAIAANLVNTSTTWKACVHDAGTPGTGTCSNNYPVSGIFADDARAFSMAYTGSGGVRWADAFAKDTASTHFVYDTVVQSPDWTHVANLELDTNAVLANGRTAILGTQCGSYSKTWEVTLINSSTGSWHWVPTNLSCNPTTWTPNTPHHVRIFGTISSTGVSTYIGVELDGNYQEFSGATGNTAEALGWSLGTILSNFQIDGLGTSGSATVYTDHLTILRW